jgi:lysophospholipase L1-like esterase
MINLIYIYLIFLTLFLFWFKYLQTSILGKPPINYPNEVNRQKHADKTSLVCFGDSNTHGNVSFDWVGQIRGVLTNMAVYNAGINADLTFTLLRRIDEVILTQPDFITLLIGTNDVNAQLSDKNLKSYRDRNKITTEENPSEELFIKNYSKILTQLKSKTKAHIAIVTLPLLTENLSATSNQICQKYSDLIKGFSVQFDVDLIDLRKEQIELVSSKKNHSSSYSKIKLAISVFLHYTFGLSWTSIGNVFGNQTSPDNIHLNEKTGNILSQLVLNWINKKEKQ